MKQVLTDMHLAEVYCQGLGDSARNRFDKNYDSLTGFYISILKHYDLSFAQFNEALDWYKKRPVLMDSLYARVLSQLMEVKSRAGLKDVEPSSDPASSATVGLSKPGEDTLVQAPKDTLSQRSDKKTGQKRGDTSLDLNDGKKKQEKSPPKIK